MTQQSRKSRRRIVAIGGVAIASAALLVGCSSDGGASDEVSFTFAYSIAETEEPYSQLIDAYMADNPDVTIEIEEFPLDSYGTTLQTRLQAGNAPDVFVTTPGASGAQTDVYSLAGAGLLAEIGGSARDIVSDDQVGLYGVDDKVYAIPLYQTSVGLIINDGTLAKSGITYPTTMGDLLDVCADLKAQDASLYTVAGSAAPNLATVGSALGGAFVYAEDPEWDTKRVNGDVTFADSGWRDALEAFSDMVDAGCFQPGSEGADFGAITGAFAANDLGDGVGLGGFVPGNNLVAIEGINPSTTFSIYGLPGETEDDQVVLFGVDYSLSVSAATKEPEAVQDFLDWWTQPENLKTLADLKGGLPAGELDTDDLSDAYAPVLDLIESDAVRELPGARWPNSDVSEALTTGLQGLFTGQSTVDGVLTAMDAAWDE